MITWLRKNIGIIISVIGLAMLAILTFGDIGLAYLTQKIGKSIEFRKLVHFLAKRNLNISIEINDILIDGYKVASFDSHDLDDVFKLVVIQILVNVNLERIKNICLKVFDKSSQKS